MRAQILHTNDTKDPEFQRGLENRNAAQFRDMLAAKMTAVQVADAQRLACEWMQRNP
jgi:hypothetical protein